MAKSKTYEMLIKIGADLDAKVPKQFQTVVKNIKSTKDQMDKAKAAWKNAGSSWKDFGKTFVKISGTVVGAAAAVSAAAYKVADSTMETALEAMQQANKMGVDAEGLTELRYAFEQMGLTADDADSVLSEMRKNLLAMGEDKEAAKALEEYGFSVEKMLKLEPDQLVEKMADALALVPDEAERARLATLVFGEEGGAAMTKAAEGGSEALQEYRKEAERTGSTVSQELADQAVAYKKSKNQMTKSLEGAKMAVGTTLFPVFQEVFDQVSQAVQDNLPAIREFGETLAGKIQEAIPKIIEIKDKIVEFAGKVWDGVTAVKDFFGGWENLAATVAGIVGMVLALKGVFAVVKTFIAVVQTIKAATEAWKWAQDMLNISMNANPIGLIILAIVALIAIIIVVIKNWDKIKEVALKVWESIKQGLSKMKDFFINVWENIKAFFSGIVQAIADKFREIVEGIKEKWNAAGEFINQIFEGVREFFVGVWEAITGFFSEKIDSISALWETVTDGLKGIGEKIKNFFKPAFDWITEKVDWVKEKFNAVKNFFTGGGSSGGGESVSVAEHASGGIFSKPHLGVVAEAGREAVIPLNKSPRAKALWNEAGRQLGMIQNNRIAAALPVSDETPAAVTGGALTSPVLPSTTSSSVRVDVSMPSITIQGNADDQTLQKLKQMLQEFRGATVKEVQAALEEAERNKRRVAY